MSWAYRAIAEVDKQIAVLQAFGEKKKDFTMSAKTERKIWKLTLYRAKIAKWDKASRKDDDATNDTGTSQKNG